MFLFLVSCRGQETISVKISNRSSSAIDSIITNHQKIKSVIKSNEDTIITVNIKGANIYHEGAIGINLYQKGIRKNATVGFHDMGMVSEFNVFVFNEGVFNTDKPIMPKEFYIYFSVSKDQSIDSIFDKNGLISIYEDNPNARSLKFDFKKFSEHPSFEAIVSGKKQEFKFDFHNFNDWNSTSEHITIRMNGRVQYLQDKVITDVEYNNEYKQYFTILIEDSENKFSKQEVSIFSNCNCIDKIYKTNTYYRVLCDIKKLEEKSTITLKTNDSQYNYYIKNTDMAKNSGNALSLVLKNKALKNILDE